MCKVSDTLTCFCASRLSPLYSLSYLLTTRAPEFHRTRVTSWPGGSHDKRWRKERRAPRRAWKIAPSRAPRRAQKKVSPTHEWLAPRRGSRKITPQEEKVLLLLACQSSCTTFSPSPNQVYTFFFFCQYPVDHSQEEPSKWGCKCDSIMEQNGEHKSDLESEGTSQSSEEAVLSTELLKEKGDKKIAEKLKTPWCRLKISSLKELMERKSKELGKA